MRAVVLSVAAVAVTVTIISVVVTRGQQKDVVATQATATRTEVATLTIPEMFCPGCEVGVKIAANKIDGVKEVRTDSDKRTAEVIFDPTKTTPQAVASAITKGTGFKTEVARQGKTKG